MKRIYISFLILTVLLIAGNAEAQIKIGTNGATIAPSSLLELESANQGLLLPRMADTVAINALAPPNGMLIYLTKAPAVGLYVRKVTGWEFLTGSLGGNGNFNSLTVAGSVTAGSFSGPLTGNASTATLAATATNSNNAAVTNDISNPATTYPVFVNSTPGYQPLRTSSGNLSYVPATGILTARGFAGPLTGDVTGNATSAIDAQNTVNIRITDDIISPTPMYPTFVNGTTGPIPARVSSTKLSFIPLSGELTATTFRGALLGNASSATSVTGVVNAVNGGTGFAVYTPGDILYSDASNTLAKLPIGLPGTILRVDPNRVPQWSTAGAGTVINVSGTSNRIVVTDPTVSPQIDIDANYVGQPSITTLGTISAGTWNGSTLSSTYGGTGVTSLTANEVLIGRGPGNSIGSISLVNTLGKVLTSNGPNALPTFEAPGVGDMILNAVQTVTGGKTFEDGTLNLEGAISGVAILKADPSTGGTITLPGGNRTLVSLDGTENLTNKTIVAANLTGTTDFNTLDGAALIINGAAALTTTAQTGTAGSIVMSNAPTIAGPTFTGVVTNSGSINSTGNITAPLFNGPAFTAQRIGSGSTERDATTIANAVDRSTDATSANQPSQIVSRDATGDFSAGTITADLAGNAATATILATSRQIFGHGFDGSAPLTGVIAPNYGGTGVDNATNTMTMQGNISHLGNFTQTIRATVNSDVFLPQSGTLYSNQTGTITSASFLGAVSNETGTGSVVFSASPALTGTPTAPTQAVNNNSVAIATTEYADRAVTNLGATKQNNLVNSAGLAASLSDETGTGAAVFADAPTFTTGITTPAITLGATAVTTSGARLNLLTSAGGTTGLTTSNLVFSNSPTLVTPILGAGTVSTLRSNSPAPVATAGGGITSTTLVGTNLSGYIEIVSDGLGAGNSALVTVAYTGFTFVNSFPSLTPGNSATAAIIPTQQVYVVGNAANFEIYSGNTTLPAGTYRWYYMVTGN